MDIKQKEKRKRIMKRSINLGHCVCDPRKPCPCPIFKEHDVCECAGERLPIKDIQGEIKLTDYVRSAGCASKIGKKDLRNILSQLPEIDDERVLVGSSAGDDAGVVVLNKDASKALILTVDVFAPSVDDPYTFGQVAAANSLSDVYAMGGKPVAALSVIGFPIYHLPNEIMAEILRGGLDKMKEAGISVVGGHSINDEEIKCGFAVIGECGTAKVKRNAGAQVGDAIILTKPIGAGLVAFASQINKASDTAIKSINASMTTLNKSAAEIMSQYNVHAATDITGYSLIGHMVEIVKNSKIKAELDFDAIPLFKDVAELARQDIIPGAVERNKEAVAEKNICFSEINDIQANILFSPETSGGLLIFTPQAEAEDMLAKLNNAGCSDSAIIGNVTEANEEGLIKVKSQNKCSFSPLDLKQKDSSCCSSATPTTQESSCCTSEQTSTQSCCSTAPSEESSCCSGDADTSQDCCSSSQSESTSSCCSSDSTDEAFSPTARFQKFLGEVTSAGAIELKNKKLMAISLSLVTKCEPCVKININAAKNAGASNQEVSEAIEMGIAFGGASVFMFYNSIKHKI